MSFLPRKKYNDQFIFDKDTEGGNKLCYAANLPFLQ